MTIRSIFRYSMAAMMAVSLLIPVNAAAENKAPRPPGTHAQAASLIDVKSGRILYSHKGDVEMPVASLTKIMTAIVAIEHGKLDDVVTVTKNAYRKEGSSIYLELGEEMKLENLLYGLMLRSGNDAATAIAEHVGGSEEGFVHLMNEKVKMLGLKHTQFQNPHGLDAKGHYSSANDLAVITAYSLQNPVFKEIVKTRSKRAPNPNNPWDYKWDNKNKMLRFYEGADGVKTGYTKTARRCLVSSASRAGQQLAVVTLNDGDDWNDHQKLLDYGFANYPLKKIIEAGQPVENGLVTGTGFSYALASGELERVERRLFLQSARAKDFGYSGKIKISLDGHEIGQVPVYEQGSFIPSPDPAGGNLTSKAAFAGGGWGNSFAAVIKLLLLVD
ncbi:D-alanyl-D-alanine carboxypeptidase family protein [Paenibacillus sp. FSL W8-0186]|uniref:D-alanyl-D-alanine carboxypeptidase n=1 Tax=Paenibacillus woosongensis TaxID=307580 RepID=A0ABQ4MQB6_9BACL|nr:D-alanyl-D-alanine carboxypeptidase family protein [Paenibacillus woosongensis]GIP58151.1 D-alanyl-D-alanine carboxypeptidase [Paenibacillus woosongensis]